MTGFEPVSLESKSNVLPLHYTASTDPAWYALPELNQEEACWVLFLVANAVLALTFTTTTKPRIVQALSSEKAYPFNALFNVAYLVGKVGVEPTTNDL